MTQVNNWRNFTLVRNRGVISMVARLLALLNNRCIWSQTRAAGGFLSFTLQPVQDLAIRLATNTDRIASDLNVTATSSSLNQAPSLYYYLFAGVD